MHCSCGVFAVSLISPPNICHCAYDEEFDLLYSYNLRGIKSAMMSRHEGATYCRVKQHNAHAGTVVELHTNTDVTNPNDLSKYYLE